MTDRPGPSGRRRPGRPHSSRPLVLPERRARFVLAVALAVLVLFVGRLVQVQAVDSGSVAADALADRMGAPQVLLAPRGDVVDASGEVLATSVERRVITADQNLVGEYERYQGEGTERELVSSGLDGAVRDLAGLLGTGEGDLRESLDGDAVYSVVARGVTPAVWSQVDALGIPGIFSERSYARTYPAGALAGNVLGFTGGDTGAGMAGIEATQDDVLAGTDGSQSVERGLNGQVIPMGESERVEPVAGSSVRLTIDRDLQWYAQERAAAMAEQAEAEWVSVVAQDVRTGEVLALAEAPGFDPNAFGEAEPEELGSRAVSDVFEPGSTSKVVTAAAALEEGVVEPLSQFEVPYRWEASNGQSFRDSHQHDLEHLTFAGVLGESSNTGTVQVGERLSRDQRHDYMQRFGFGTPTGIELPGEAPGILGSADSWDSRQQYTVLFGQGVSVNALQAAGVYATIANDGVRVPPRLVAGTVDPDGTEHPAPAPRGERVVSEETAQQVSTMLEGVVADGTGDSAAIEGYRVAGKTGTAEAPDENGGYTGYTSSFIGYAPADDPEVVVAVTVQRPTNGFYGGQVAAPVFKDVLSFALSEREVPPSGTPARLYPQTW